MDIIFSLIVTLVVIVSIILAFIFLNRKYVEVDMTRKRIYGWYNNEILVVESFNDLEDIEGIIAQKKNVEESLDNIIESFKNLKKHLK